ncbi:MAG: hypothetical protein PHT08_02385 [Bacteroidales bacterium]|nr:hypothetical protein [Bacteroidales bacterium]
MSLIPRRKFDECVARYNGEIPIIPAIWS